uniref:ubiquitinyl hydrolase 1 n=1 Tax=Esox lucius TaxID=8010 RepID=A0A3P8YX40_ESOLU
MYNLTFPLFLSICLFLSPLCLHLSASISLCLLLPVSIPSLSPSLSVSISLSPSLSVSISLCLCVSDLFSGQLRSSLHCSVCSHYSTCFDVFGDLSLPIPKRSAGGGVSLRECLDLFSQEEKLDEDNAPMCERCNRRTESTKRLTIQRFPQVIVMHLNRFALSRYAVCKSSVCVSFPLAGLDMGSYGPVDFLYDLYAVCNHSGTVNMGHYTAFCLDDDGSGWYCYNDSTVTPVSENQLQSSQAYVLFYQRRK